MGPSLVRAWGTLALFAIGFVVFLLAPLAVMGVAALAYGLVSYNGRHPRVGRGAGRFRRSADRPAAAALPASRGAGFGGGVR